MHSDVPSMTSNLTVYMAVDLVIEAVSDGKRLIVVLVFHPAATAAAATTANPKCRTRGKDRRPKSVEKLKARQQK